MTITHLMTSDIQLVPSLNTVFQFTHDDFINNRAGHITTQQSDRLNRVFHNAFKASRKDILQDIVFLGSGNLILFVGAANLGAYVASLIMLAITITYMRDKVIGRRSIRAVYRRQQLFKATPTIEAIKNVSPAKFVLNEGHRVYTRPYFEFWFQTYQWFDLHEMASSGWYSFTDDNGIEIIVAPYQFTALNPTTTYTFYCFADTSKFAYVLSVEAQLNPHQPMSHQPASSLEAGSCR